MTILNPSLDDKPFQDLIEEAKKKIPIYVNTWTDHNLSDPGITFIELFAWIAEMQLYSLNKITDKNRLKFLKLLGVSVLQPVLPKLDVTFSPRNINTFVLAKNSRMEVEVSQSGEKFFFETDDEINIVPLKIGRIATLTTKGFLTNYSSFASFIENQGYFYALGDVPTPGSALYIGLVEASLDYMTNQTNLQRGSSRSKISNIIFGKPMNLSLYLYEQDLIPLATHGSETPNVTFSNKVVWEYLRLDDRIPFTTSWRDLEVIRDSTYGLTKSGIVTFNYPFNKEDKLAIGIFESSGTSDNISTKSGSRKKDLDSFFWIRCRLIEGGYEIPPRISFMTLNTVSATYSGESVTESKLVDLQLDPFSDSLFELKESNRPILKVHKVSVYYNEEQQGEERERRVLYFLNNAKTIEEIANVIKSNRYDDDDDEYELARLNFGQRIMRSRQILGEFASLDDIGDFSGIDKSIFNKLVTMLKDIDIPWTQVDDFDASNPDDHHYTVDYEDGVLHFGNGKNGRRVPIGSRIEVLYSYGNIENVSVKPNEKFTVITPNTGLSNIEGKNTFPSTRGKRKDSILETIIRARAELTIPFKAVTANDFEYIALHTPGLRVARAKAFTYQQISSSADGRDNNYNNANENWNRIMAKIAQASPLRRQTHTEDRSEGKGQGEEAGKNEQEKIESSTLNNNNNTVTVIVVPYIAPTDPTKNPIPSKEFLDTVCRHLDKHRLITTKLNVIGPEYVGISISAAITVDNSADPERVKQMVAEALESFLSPIARKEGQEAWPFGRSVYVSEAYAMIERVEGVNCVIQVILYGSGSPKNFENKEGNIKINNMCLVYLKSYSIYNLTSPVSDHCRNVQSNNEIEREL